MTKDLRYCENCGNLITKRYTESQKTYGNRRYCSHRCNGEIKKNYHPAKRDLTKKEILVPWGGQEWYEQVCRRSEEKMRRKI